MNSPIEPTRRRVSLLDLLQEQARDLYDAESAYQAALPQLEEAAADPQLAEQLSEIQEQVRENLRSLEEICEKLEIPARGVTCEAMKGLLREANSSTADYQHSSVMDAAIIANAQRIVHYEIAGFGTARAFANKLKRDDVGSLFGELLDAAKQTDRDLTRIAVGGWFSDGINDEALAPSPG